MDNLNKLRRGSARLFTGLALIAAASAPLSTFAADAAAPAAQLSSVRKGIPHDALYALNIAGKNGLAAGAAGTILETKDGGGTWNQVESGTKFGLFGIGVAGEHRLICGQRGTVLLDQGGKWTPANTGSESRLLNVDVNASGLAVAVGEFGTILRSKDGGKTWEKRTLPWAEYRDDGYEPHVYAVDVQDSGRVILGAEFAYVLISDDGGENFKLAHKGEKSVFSIHMLADGTGYAAGQEGMILKTTNNGESWDALKSGSEANLFGIWASPQGEVVATGMRALLRSSDAGATFTSSQDPEVVRNWFVPVAMGEAEMKGDGGAMVQQVVYIAGYNGTIARVLR